MSFIMCCQKIKTFFKSSSSKKDRLKVLYKNNFKSTIFYQDCIACMNFFQDLDQEINEDEVNQNYLKKSVIKASHYLQDNISINQQQQSGNIPYSIQSYTETQRNQTLKKLIEESFLFLDLSDILQGSDLNLYESTIKEQIFEGQRSILYSQSFMQQKQTLEDRIKSFQPQAIDLLQMYVQFCRQMKYEFAIQNQTFLGKLVLRLKTKVIQCFPSAKVQKSSLKKFIQNIQIIVEILLNTIQIIYNLKIISEEDNQEICFYSEVNLQTLIMSLLFQDQDFQAHVFSVFKNALGKTFSKTQSFQSYEFYHNLYKISCFEEPKIIIHPSNTSKLMNQTQKEQNYFVKSKKMIQKIINKNQPKQPIRILKIIYQIHNQIQKQYKQYLTKIKKQSGLSINQLLRKFPLTRQNQSLIKKWLLIGDILPSKNEQNRNFDKIIQVLITYVFIHQEYRKGKKGSCLIPFVECSQNILQWSI